MLQINTGSKLINNGFDLAWQREREREREIELHESRWQQTWFH
jgi:hypothetical protein